MQSADTANNHFSLIHQKTYLIKYFTLIISFNSYLASTPSRLPTFKAFFYVWGVALPIRATWATNKKRGTGRLPDQSPFWFLRTLRRVFSYFCCRVGRLIPAVWAVMAIVTAHLVPGGEIFHSTFRVEAAIVRGS